MESRIRKLLSPKRLKANNVPDSSELDLHSVPYTTAPPQGRLPVFINHALGKSSSTKRQMHLPTDLRSLSYQSTLPGKPPQLGERPQRGNGPVKLQTSRRLSSGELLITQQDYDRTLEEIREGDFIVGGKAKRTSRTSSSQFSPSMRQPELKVLSTAPNSPRGRSTFSSVQLPPSAASDLPISGYHPRSFSTSSSFLHERQPLVEYGYTHTGSVSNPGTLGLGISSPTHSLFPRHVASTTSLLEPHEEQNPTIQALWKAEYSRLVSIYGQPGVDRNILELHRDEPSMLDDHHNPYESTPYGLSTYPTSSVSLQQQPSYSQPEHGRSVLGLRSHMSTSHLETGYRDDHSEGSSNHRHSLLSSSGASSSFTTRTSMAEEFAMTRDDLRRIVDDMRMTYLHAIEAHTPPLEPLPEMPMQKSRSKKQTRSLASSASVESGLRSISGQKKIKSWQLATPPITTPRTSTSSPSFNHHKNWRSSGHARRTSAQHAAGITTLSPIKASPARPKRAETSQDENVGLKRADSTTLGSLAKGLKIHDNHDSSMPSESALTSSPTFYNTSSSESFSGPYKTSSSGSFRPSTPEKTALARTPEKSNTTGIDSSVSSSSWRQEADRLFEDTEIDLAVDIDGFESLCDDLFNSPALRNNSFNTLSTWAGSTREAADVIDDGAASGNPPTAISRPTVFQNRPGSAAPPGMF
ncbi:hypothetical protein LTR47_006397 [Exophiala xenobiotica]|nr:hypothetical protein LTR47_006397 [Exophiala xenobiotica]KAK5251624.1 hypothetical protein LTS06_003768 [Exophiala xenobiotica]KAK5323953.1 hypothetical protein LTR93_004739 [Exophiala xenobiotica]KAK5355278.1 hypothetical protein LTR61_000949 [Exophiala xenobiotica]KAK5368304.1 hypothetical protein LTR11_007642 [Exophiala xenobiotica]